MIENATEDLVPSVIEILGKGDPTKHFGTEKMLRFGGKSYKALSTFDLFITTALEKPHFNVYVQNNATIVNF